MWMRWNDTTHIFEQSTNDGASWAVLPLNASILTEGVLNSARIPATSLPANVAYKDSNNNFSVAQTIVGGLNITSGGITVTAGGLTVTGNSVITGTLGVSGVLSSGPHTVTGLINATGVGTHTLLCTGVGGAGLRVQNSTAAANTAGVLIVGNDANANLFQVLVYSSLSVGSGYIQANGTVFYVGGSGGLSVLCADANAIMRFYTNSVERLRIDQFGGLVINTQANISNSLLHMAYDESTHHGIGMQCTINSGNAMMYINAAGAFVGGITQSVSGVAFNTTSDVRLKIDRGQVSDLTKLRKVIIHDFEWRIDKTASRGLFAQEAYAIYPEAIVKGTDELLEDDQIIHPWLTDYTKFIPDLIAGWQEHDREITELKERLNGRRTN